MLTCAVARAYQAFQRVVDRISEKVESMEEDAPDIPLSTIMQDTLKELTWVRRRTACSWLLCACVSSATVVCLPLRVLSLRPTAARRCHSPFRVLMLC